MEDIDYNKHIENVITKITGVMSLYLLIERLNLNFIIDLLKSNCF